MPLFDLWSLGLLTQMGVSFVVAQVSPSFDLWIDQPAAQFLLLWLLFPLVLLVEATVYAAFGNTFGKALMGLVVVTSDGKRADPFEYLKRQAGVYWYGLGAALPPLALFTMARQQSRLAAGRRARYDEGRFSVRATGQFGLARGLAAAAAVAGLVVAFAALGHALSGYERGDQLATARLVGQVGR